MSHKRLNLVVNYIHKLNFINKILSLNGMKQWLVQLLERGLFTQMLANTNKWAVWRRMCSKLEVLICDQIQLNAIIWSDLSFKQFALIYDKLMISWMVR